MRNFLTFAELIYCLTLIKTIYTIMKALGYIGAFLGGAIAGAALGIIAAPESGADTRKKIASTVKDFCDKHNIELSRKEMAELAEDLVAVNDL